MYRTLTTVGQHAPNTILGVNDLPKEEVKRLIDVGAIEKSGESQEAEKAAKPAK